jgi:hypothetical protein
MKKLILFVAVACLYLPAISQKYIVMSGTIKHIPVSQFPWNNRDKAMGEKQLTLADSIYNMLASGQAIRLSMLDESEKDFTSKEIANLTYARAEAFIRFCLSKNIPQTDFYAEIVPYDMPNTIRTSELEHRSYKTFMSNNARTYFVFSRPAAVATAKPSVNFDENFTKGMESFSMFHDRNIYAYLNSGTTVFIPKGALQFSNGQKPSCTKIDLKITEYLDMDAMVMKSMTTSSYGKKLQTAGMWHIEASCGGQPLYIKPGKQYHIYVAIDGEPKDMRVFTGSKKDGLLDWKEETDSKVYKPGESTSSVEPEEGNDSTDYEGEREYETSGLGVIGYEAPTNTYDIALNDFGWINCDAFDEEQKLTNLMVHGDLKDHEVMLVYAKRKSVLPGYLCEDQRSVKFADIASNEACMLVVFKKTDDKGSVIKHIQMIDPSKTTSVNVTTESSTLAQLQTEIKSKLSDY